MKFQILARWSNTVRFECELTDEEAALPVRDQRGIAIKKALKSDSNLRDSNLRGSDLSDSNLTPIRDDLWAVLSGAPLEVDGLLSALKEGRVDGSTYEGECACLVGTIAHVAGTNYGSLAIVKPDSSRPIERFFMGIRKGDTPETNQVSALAVEWTEDWRARMALAFGKAATP